MSSDCEERAKVEGTTVLPITICGEPVLHRKSDPVTEFDSQLRTLVDDMFETCEAAPPPRRRFALRHSKRALLRAQNIDGKLVDAGARPLVGGNTIGMNRRFISRYMPTLDERLHYRSIDVSTVKELARQWHPKAFFGAPEKHGGHRALADIAESIQELAYFQAAVMLPFPGPT